MADPRKRSKKYQQNKGLVDRNKEYSVADAIALAKKTSYSSFDGSMELHATTKKEGVSVQVTMPHSAGKQKKVEIADAGTIKKLTEGKVDFDILLATADMMPKLVPFAKILGPRGMMPNPKNGTLIKDAKAAEKFSGNSMSVKTEKKAPLIHTVFGKVSQKEKELEENLEAIFAALGKRQVIKAYIKASMGPSIKVSVL